METKKIFVGVLSALAMAVLPAVEAGAQQITSCLSSVGPQNVAVIAADFKGADPDSFLPNLDYLRELFVGSEGGVNLQDYLTRISNHKSTLGKLVFLGPYHYSGTVIYDPRLGVATESVMEQWEKIVLGMADRDIKLTQFDRIIFVTPSPVDVQTGKAYSLGAGRASYYCDLDYKGISGTKKFANAWILSAKRYQGFKPTDLYTDWARLTVPEQMKLIQDRKILDMQPIMHEWGHTMGLGHANRVLRPMVNSPANKWAHDEVLPDANAKLYENTYGDYFSFMSSSAMGWPSAFHLGILGYLPKEELKIVNSSGTFRLYPLSDSAVNLKSLEIPRVKTANQKTNANIWVEYRHPENVYESSGIAGMFKTDGAVVRYTNPDQPSPQDYQWPNETILLNFQPPGSVEPAFDTDFVLRDEWKDPHSLVDLKVLQVTPAYLDVQVTIQ